MIALDKEYRSNTPASTVDSPLFLAWLTWDAIDDSTLGSVVGGWQNRSNGNAQASYTDELCRILVRHMQPNQNHLSF